MKRLLPLLLLIVVPAPSTALADVCPPLTCGTTSSAPPGSDVVFVRPNARQGPLEAYDVRTGERRFRLLTYGVLSADGRTYVSSVPGKDNRSSSTITRRDASSGEVVRRWRVRGRWGVGGTSPDGRVVAYVRGLQNALVLRVHGRRYVLRGTHEIEALSPNGRKIFLVHWRRNRYDLRQLDLVTRKVTATRLDEPDEKMTGQATTAVATRDGHWLLTLYSKRDRHSFVHALDLRTGIAHCVDLPLVGDLYTIGSTALTLSPDETKLYLASPYIGRVATIDLATLEVAAVRRFRAPRTYVVNTLVGPSGAVTPNGRMLAFSAGKLVWLYDAMFGVLRKATSVRSAVTGLGFDPDGRSLLVLQRRGSPVFLDAATGKRR